MYLIACTRVKDFDSYFYDYFSPHTFTKVQNVNTFAKLWMQAMFHYHKTSTTTIVS